MTDPLSIVAISATVGGVAGKFVEKAWDAGERYLSRYYSDHGQQAKTSAETNAKEFLAELAARVSALENSGEVPKSTIDSAQDHPGFAMTLHLAMTSAAQTESRDKHEILARLVADRLASSPDSLLAVASKLGCEAIAGATGDQLRVLGLLAVVFQLTPSRELEPAAYAEWLRTHLAPFEELQFSRLDLLHLEAISCAKVQPFLAADLKNVLASKNARGLHIPTFFETPTAKAIQLHWEKGGLQSVSLTSVGTLIGIYVADMVSGGNTNLSNFR